MMRENNFVSEKVPFWVEYKIVRMYINLLSFEEKRYSPCGSAIPRAAFRRDSSSPHHLLMS